VSPAADSLGGVTDDIPGWAIIGLTFVVQQFKVFEHLDVLTQLYGRAVSDALEHPTGDRLPWRC
jgi:hypothetical protein